MIKVDEIKNTAFETLNKKFDESIDNLKSHFNIELKTYGNFLRIVLNNIQPDSFDNLIERVNINRELENALSNAGGYTTDFLGENNPKARLKEIITHLQTNSLKFIHLIKFLNKDNSRKTVIADSNDIDHLNQKIRNNRIKIISLSQLKGNIYEYDNLVFYSFNGKKDFDFIYNLQADVSLVLFAQEHQLYKSQLQKRKHLIESEVRSNDRKNICGISYEPIPDLPIHISQTIESIVNRIDNLNEKAYENYKEDTDTLLDELEKNILRITFSNHRPEYLDSVETVYTENGDLIKVYLSRIKVGDKIRIYPREQFAEKLYQVAAETDKDVFGKVEEHSKKWKGILSELKTKWKDTLYSKLEAKPYEINVSAGRVEKYSTHIVKFPMYKNDLRAIFSLHYSNKSKNELEEILKPIFESKRIYSSVMISLGRGIKQEIKLFLKEKRIGEILAKLKFNATTMQTFIDEHMPLSAITGKEVYIDANGQLELNFIQQLEL